jgi:sugar/nucleoside kinase (ribokinase family)
VTPDDVLAVLRTRRALVTMSRPCVDVRLEVDQIPAAGAKTLVRASTTLAGGVDGNFASALASLRVHVRAVGSGSSDPIAEIDRSSLREHGVDVRWDEESAGAAVVCHVMVDPRGERAVLVSFPLHEDHRVTEGVLRSATAAAAEQWDLVYLGVLRPVHTGVLRVVRPSAGMVVTTLEAGEFPGAWLQEVAGGLDVVLAAEEVLSDHGDRLLDLGRRHGWTLVVTAGAEGATLYAPDGGTHHEPAVDPGVPVQDTTGAGDAFGAAYCAGLLAGLPPAAALRPATWFAAQSIRGPGPRSFPPAQAFAQQVPAAHDAHVGTRPWP